jgi:hypothetical protein
MAVPPPVFEIAKALNPNDTVPEKGRFKPLLMVSLLIIDVPWMPKSWRDFDYLLGYVATR